MTPYRTLLFDFDGTLVPSLEFWLQAFQHALAQFRRELPEHVIITRFFYRSYHDVAAEFELPSGAELERHVLAGLNLAFAAPRLYPGVREVLDLCRRRGVSLGLVTSSPRPPVLTALEHLGIAGFFPVIVTGDDITHYKPHPEPVLQALGRLEACASETLFVGDYAVDVLAGRDAGVRTALFLPDAHARFYDLAALRATRPDFVFTDYAALSAHLQSRLG